MKDDRASSRPRRWMAWRGFVWIEGLGIRPAERYGLPSLQEIEESERRAAEKGKE